MKDKPKPYKCYNCDKDGMMDTGALAAWDTPLKIVCPYCEGKGYYTVERSTNDHRVSG